MWIRSSPIWRPWSLVYTLVAMASLLAVPWVDRAERRFPLAFPLALVAVGLLRRFEVADPGLPNTGPVLWLFALGWTIARTRTVLQRCAVSAIAVLTVPGIFENPAREATLLAGLLLLTWLPAVPVPTGLRRLTELLANASLYAYLTHWLVFPPLAAIHPALAVAASLAAGVAYWALSMQLMGAARRWWKSTTTARRNTPGPNTPGPPAPPRSAALPDHVPS
jgi:hypothetical protein